MVTYLLTNDDNCTSNTKKQTKPLAVKIDMLHKLKSEYRKTKITISR